MQKTVVRTSFHLATKNFILAGLLCFSALLGCQTAGLPVEEHTLARAAMDAARSVESARYSPGHWHQAEEAYRKAELYIKDREYDKARGEFLRARTSAEKAENSARLIRQKNGEVL